MSEAFPALPATATAMATPTTAGALLRQAREKQGLQIEALSAATKVTPRKLLALEADRFNELPDATFTRALAQTICRSLKIDAAPVLALLPPPNGHRLEQVAEGLKTPFRERPGRLGPREWAKVSNVAIWGPLVLLLAAALVYLLPSGLFPVATVPGTRSDVTGDNPTPGADGSTAMSPPTPAPAVGDVSPPAAAPPAVDAIVTAAASEAAASEPGTGGAAPAVQVSAGATTEAWVEITDARGQALVYRTLKAGETVGVDGSMPFKVTIGNARSSRLTWRGQPVDLKPHTRDSIARLELK